MTDLLEKAFAQATKLSAEFQDVMADWLLKEPQSENRWDRSVAASQDALANLGSEALKTCQDALEVLYPRLHFNFFQTIMHET